MLKQFLAGVWRRMPRGLRRGGVRLMQPKFNVTVGAVITNDDGRVLLLKHVFRPGSGWGVPGGFINKKEDPIDALRREMREEINLEIEDAQLALIRTLKVTPQVEIFYRCRPGGNTGAKSMEISEIGWFLPDELPEQLSSDQRRLIQRILHRD
jgi:8-oxo-dGTP diphosphatase